jgi:hypothetical protein
MDHQNLAYYHEPQKLTRHQVNWTTCLQDYNYIIKHVLGVANGRVDMLSRPEGIEKSPSKVVLVLPDWLFIRVLTGMEQLGEELTTEEKVEQMKKYHNSPVAGHPGVK